MSDDIVENTEDTMTLLEKYIDELDVTMDKDRLKNTMRSLYKTEKVTGFRNLIHFKYVRWRRNSFFPQVISLQRYS